MKTYTFPWICDEAYGEIEMEISEEEVELIKEAYRNAFEYLGDDADLDGVQERALQLLDFYDPDLGQDIRICFPEEITDEADAEDEE